MQKATIQDIPAIKQLLIDNKLPVEDLNKQINFFMEKDKNQVICVGGLEKHGKYSLIRSIAVDDNFKGTGLGSKMTDFLIKQAKFQNFEGVYLLTLTAEKFFPKFGFQKISRDQTPPEIKSSSEFSSVCPDSAVVMELRLNPL